jgi:hypothetical protein
MPSGLVLHRAPRELRDRRPAPMPADVTAPVATIVSARERARRRFVLTVFAIYLLVIFEGSLRKYVAPQFGQYIFFIRDPFVVFAFAVASAHGLWPRNHALLNVAWAMGALGVLLFAAQCAIFGLDTTRLILGIYGWRAYFLYVPLAFLIGANFDAEDLRRIAKLTLFLSVPVAVLIFFQFFSPPDAAINVGVAEDRDLQFQSVGVTAERIRTTGPFTSNQGQAQFTTLAFVFVLAAALAARRTVGTPLLLAATGATLTCAALSNSRGTMLSLGLVGLFGVGLALGGRGAALKTKALLIPAGLLGLGFVLFPIVFPEGYESFMFRWDSAATVESGLPGGILGRAILGLLIFTNILDVVPMLGYGLGYGGNASNILGAEVDGVKPSMLAEADFSRHIVDLGPLFGIGYIAFRLVLLVWLTRQVVVATRSRVDPMPMLLFAYVGNQILSGQITGHGSINGFAWIATGLCIAAARGSTRRPVADRRWSMARLGTSLRGALPGATRPVFQEIR